MMERLRDPEGPWVIVAAAIVALVGGLAGVGMACLYSLTDGEGAVLDGRWFIAGILGGIVLFMGFRRIARSSEGGFDSGE